MSDNQFQQYTLN